MPSASGFNVTDDCTELPASGLSPGIVPLLSSEKLSASGLWLSRIIVLLITFAGNTDS